MDIITCPYCATKLRLQTAIPPGKRVACPKCSGSFAPAGEAEPEPPVLEVAPPRASRNSEPADDYEDERDDRPRRRSRPVHGRTDDGDEDEYEDRRASRRFRRRPVRGGSNTALIVGLVIGGGVLVLGAIIALAIALWPSGSNYSKHEAAAQEVIQLMRELAEALESVRDPASARTAAAKIEQICDRIEKLEQKLKSLPKITQAEDKRLKNKFEPELNQVAKRAENSAFQAGVNSGGEPSFVAALRRLERLGNRLQRLGW